MKIGLCAMELPTLLYNLNVPLVSHTIYISHGSAVVGQKEKHTLATAEGSLGLLHSHTHMYCTH